MFLKITDEMEKEIKKWWGKELTELTNEEAKEIVEEFKNIRVKYADFETDDFREISYTEEEEEPEYESSDYVSKGWTEEYLNTLGMSMSDFV